MLNDPDYGALPRTLGALLAVEQAKLMLGHLAAAPTRWPRNAIYCHSCITALRSVTLLLQKTLKHDAGFEGWWSRKRALLADDPEFVYLKEARNYVLHQGALLILGSHGFEMTDTPPGIEVRRIGPDGPEVWAPNPAGAEGDMIPVDWRKLPGFKYDVDLRIAPRADLPPPPDRELKQMLADKIEVLEAIVWEADELFPGEEGDPELESLNEDDEPDL
jgi:hypothetical protein